MSSSATVDPAFQGAGQQPGLELWHIEGMKPVKQPRVDGKLHQGDAYILLATTQKPGSKALQYALHFWLGSEASQDEIGVVAFKAVELDDALGGAAVQHREVEGHESALFLSLFKEGGLEYLPGGVASGFTTVERDVYRTRLLHVKGARVVRAKEVPLKHASLNLSDCFILDAGLQLYLYNGPQANRAEKAKALELILRIRDAERGGRAELTLVNEDDPHNEDFWAALGGEAPVTNPGEPDEAADKAGAKAVSLARVSDASGTLTITPIPTPHGKLTRSMLDTKVRVLFLDPSSLYIITHPPTH